MARNKASQEKQHSEQLHHIFFNFLFISILSKSRTKVCINGGKENKSTHSNILQHTHTHTHTHTSLCEQQAEWRRLPG